MNSPRLTTNDHGTVIIFGNGGGRLEQRGGRRFGRVDVTSLAFRTDLALLELGGSTVEDRGDHVVVRTPHNPTFWWGNFLLLDRVPQPGEHEQWIDRFAETFPDARHLAFGVDGTVGRASDLAGFADMGLSIDASTVMTATSVRRPPRPNDEAEYRRLTSDDGARLVSGFGPRIAGSWSTAIGRAGPWSRRTPKRRRGLPWRPPPPPCSRRPRTRPRRRPGRPARNLRAADPDPANAAPSNPRSGPRRTR